MKAVDLVLGFSFSDRTKAGGWGVMAVDNWQEQIDTYDKLGQFTNGAPKLSDIMTLDILEATKDVRPKFG